MSQHDPARETIDDDNDDILWDAVCFLSQEGLIGEPPQSRRLSAAAPRDANAGERSETERVEGRRHAVLLP